jgi:hypothetical protein
MESQAVTPARLEWLRLKKEADKETAQKMARQSEYLAKRKFVHNPDYGKWLRKSGT